MKRDFRIARADAPCKNSTPPARLLSGMLLKRHSSSARRVGMSVFRKLLFAFALIAAGSFTGAIAARPIAASHAAEPFVIAANPLAAQAGLNVLKRGGSAVDAAIAVQAMLSLVEPQSSGVGGGAFMTYYDGRTRKIMVYDGREIAPAQATSTMFLDSAGRPLPFNAAVLS